MHKLTTTIRQKSYKMRRDWLTAQNVVMLIAIILSIYFAIGAITSISRNWNLQAKLNNLELTKRRTEIEIETLRLEQEYYQTEEYQELMAREKLGKMLDGETMVILSQNSEAARAKDKSNENDYSVRRSNFSMWLDLIFGS